MNDTLSLVDLKQAKKLKELGFDWVCSCYYAKHNGEYFSLNVRDERNWNNTEKYPIYCSSPTVTLALKWFRDKRNVLCTIEFSSFIECYFVRVFYKAPISIVDKEFTWCTLPLHVKASPNDVNAYDKCEIAALDCMLENSEKFAC